MERDGRATRRERLGWDCLCLQTNHEGCFIEYLHEHRRADAMIVNPGAWTHYSYAIRDALELVRCPIAEVHLSDITAREEWRRHSVISPVATFTISGKGPEGYLEAVRRLGGDERRVVYNSGSHPVVEPEQRTTDRRRPVE